MKQAAPGVFCWSTPHPEYRTSVEEVCSYALVDDGMLALVDPLLPAEGNARLEPVLGMLDELVLQAERVDIFVTIPYHIRSAEPVYHRYAERLPTRLWGHENVAGRLRRKDTRLDVIPMGEPGFAASIAGDKAVAFTIGKPRRSEHPILFPGLRAVAFGDAVVGTRGGLRIWSQSSAGPRWYREVFAPTLRPILDHRIERVLVTHGPAVLEGGRAALEDCLAAEPVTSY